jgi:hypothetical protein
MARKKKIIPVEIEAPVPKGMLDKIGITDSDELMAQISKDFADSEQMKYTWIPERNKDVQSYFGVIKPSEWPFKGASQIKSQFQRIVVDTMAGNLVKSIFNPEHPIRPYPAPLGNKTADDALDNIKYVEELHNAIQNDEYHLHTMLDKAFPTALIESFCVLSPVYEYLVNDIIVDVTRYIPKDLDASTVTYDLDTDTVTTQDGQVIPAIAKEYDADDDTTEGMQEVTFQVTKEECVKDGISLKVINGYRFYMPLTSPGETPYEKVQRAPYVIQQAFYTIREFEQYRDQGYFENVDPAMDDIYDPQRELITYTKYLQAGFVRDVTQTKLPLINCLKWSGKWKINGKWQELTVWKDKNTNNILRAEPNIFGVRPYFPVVPFPIDDTPYGESLCKIIRPLVQELDLLLRTITNIALMKSAPPKFYDPASGFNPSTVGQFGPNSWIPAREPARNVLIPPQPEDPGVAMEVIKLLINFIERITGVNEVTQGQISQRANTTATEVQQAMVRSGVRFDQVYERIKDQLKPMFQYIHKLTLRRMPEYKEVRLMGAENKGRLMMIHKKQLAGEFAFELAGNSIVTEQNELQNALALYNSVGQNPYLSYKPESIYYMLYNIVKRLNPIAMNKILPKPEEVQQLERDRQKTQQEQEQMAMQQKQQEDAQANQGEAAKAQMEVQSKQAQMQLDSQKQNHDIQMREVEMQQKLRHSDEAHRQKIAQAEAMAKIQAAAELQKMELQAAQMKARIHAQSKATGSHTSDL